MVKHVVGVAMSIPRRLSIIAVEIRPVQQDRVNKYQEIFERVSERECRNLKNGPKNSLRRGCDQRQKY